MRLKDLASPDVISWVLTTVVRLWFGTVRVELRHRERFEQYARDLSLGKHPWLLREPWIHMRYGDYASIRRDYMPADYQRDADGFQVVKTVYVEYICGLKHRRDRSANHR